MPYPHDFLVQEPADARAALMAKIPSPYLDGVARRSRYLQAERPRPYRVPARPKRPLLVECRKARRVVLGWGAFLKDETLRSPEGNVVRVTEGPCRTRPLLPCVKQRPSDDCHLPLRRTLRQDSNSDEGDCSMPFWSGPATLTTQQRCNALRASCTSRDSGEDDCAMPDRTTLEYPDFRIELPKCFPPLQTVYEPEGMSDQSCVKAADEMFIMFIDENCMDE